MQRYTLYIIVLFIFLNGCASTSRIPDAPQTDTFRIIEGVPFFPQEDYQCGPASLASLLNYRGVPASPGEIADAIYSRSARGTLNIDMVIYARSKGLEAEQYRGGWEDLRARIDAGSPVIVLVDYGFSVFQSNHFMVVIGYGQDSVVAHSGRNEKKIIPREEFMRSWDRTNNWTLVIRK
jgi:predicted double-glycine peptidase